MTEPHQSFVSWLEGQAPFTAAALSEHWRKGVRYYIDDRVDIRGHRREFNRLNEMMKED